MTTLITKAIQRDLRASQLEEDARKLAGAIRAIDGNVPAEVHSTRKTVMEHRAQVWRRRPEFDLQQTDPKQITLLASPISQISNDLRGHQAVSLTVADREIFGPVDKLVNAKDNEMVQNLLKNLKLRRKAADGGQQWSPEGASHATELDTEAPGPRKPVEKVRSAIRQRQYYSSDTEIGDISDSSVDKGNSMEMVEASIPADLDQKFHGFDVLHEALELVAAAETMTQLQRKDIRVEKRSVRDEGSF